MFCCTLRNLIIAYGIFEIAGSLYGIVDNIRIGLKVKDDYARMKINLSIGSFIINVALTASLIFGAFKEKRIYLMPYLVIQCFGLCVVTIAVVMASFQSPTLLFLLILIGSMWWMWMLVLKFYKSLPQNFPPHSAHRYTREVIKNGNYESINEGRLGA